MQEVRFAVPGSTDSSTGSAVPARARGVPRPVQVRHEGRWVRGMLLAAYRSGPGGRWRGVVRYAVAPGEQYQQARWAEDLRAADESGGESAPGSGQE